MINKRIQANRRAARTRAKIYGTAKRPRLTVKRSLSHIDAQLVNDEVGRTIVSASDLELTAPAGSKVERARSVGELLAQKAVAQKIETVIFDRGSYKYHGRVRALAEGARQAGLAF